MQIFTDTQREQKYWTVKKDGELIKITVRDYVDISSYSDRTLSGPLYTGPITNPVIISEFKSEYKREIIGDRKKVFNITDLKDSSNTAPCVL